tara:strand:- start:829 stop:1023 length:195 start_codon:yes stop_codon:yes gene_type:complete
MDDEKLDRIIALLENLILRKATPQSKDIVYWSCTCGFENIGLESSPRECLICGSLEPLRIEAAK